MKHIKTYEKFSDIWSNVKNIFTREDDKMYNAELNSKEINTFKEFGFEVSQTHCEYKSPNSDINIIVNKFYDETVPGYAPGVFQITVEQPSKRFSKMISGLDDVIKFIKEIIPEEELTATKYNL